MPARRTGYHLRFSRVIYRGERGLFGEAVLTAAIESADSQDFEACCLDSFGSDAVEMVPTGRRADSL